MRGIELPRVAPAHFDNVTKPHRCQKIRSRRRCDHGHVAPEAAQRSHIEMIHVRMRQETEIERRQLARLQRRSDVPLGSERQGLNRTGILGE